jgi:ABC-type phosphate/phosphonate transport system substrate-binding protein
MRRILIAAATVLATGAASAAGAQPDPAGDTARIHFTYVRIEGHSVLERQLDAVFESLLSRIRVHDPGFRYQTAEAQLLMYSTRCTEFESPAIITLSPAKYLQCRERTGDTLVPLFLVVKRREHDPYYSASFIASGSSSVRSLRSEGIRRLVLVDSNSASGFIAPLNKLWEMNVIDAPTLDGVRRKGWEVSFAGSHPAVGAAVARDSTAIGATDEYQAAAQTARGEVQTLLRYSTLPQDVIAITPDLLPHRAAIEQGLREFFATDSTGALANPEAVTLSRASTGLTGVVPFSGTEHANAFAELERMRQRLHGRGVPLVFRGITRRELLAAGAALFVLLAAAGFLFGNLVGLGREREPRLALACALVLLVLWGAFFFYPEELRIDRRIAFFVLLFIGSSFGVLMRWVFNALDIAIPGRRPWRRASGCRWS